MKETYDSKKTPADRATVSADDLLYVIRVLAAVIDAGDPYTRGRSQRMLLYCRKLGERLGVTGRDLADLEYAALLHDIGRFVIHRDVLLKRGPLSADERELTKRHPEVAYELLKEIPVLSRAAEYILAHHEQPDGHGYPRGLSGDAVPLPSRILLAVSAFDALMFDRPYRPGIGAEDAILRLQQSAGSMFSPEIIEALAGVHDELTRSGAPEIEEAAPQKSAIAETRAAFARIEFVNPQEAGYEIEFPVGFDPLASTTRPNASR
jgi:HD-GYP domain-containing protein (c-di-GMP phosphodiesterase class II)